MTLFIYTEEHLQQLQSIIDIIKPKKAKPVAKPLETVAGFSSMTGQSVAIPIERTPAQAQAAAAEQARADAEKANVAKSASPAFEIYHPMLALWRIHRVHVIEGSIPEYKEREDRFEVKFKLQEVGAKKAAVADPSTAKSFDLTSLDASKALPAWAAAPPSQTNSQPRVTPAGASGS